MLKSSSDNPRRSRSRSVCGGHYHHSRLFWRSKKRHILGHETPAASPNPLAAPLPLVLARVPSKSLAVHSATALSTADLRMGIGRATCRYFSNSVARCTTPPLSTRNCGTPALCGICGTRHWHGATANFVLPGLGRFDNELDHAWKQRQDGFFIGVEVPRKNTHRYIVRRAPCSKKPS
jgi:hypothetical protein